MNGIKVYNGLMTIALMLIFTTGLFFITPPIHEGLHYLQSSIDKDLNPIGISLYTPECFNMGALGYCQTEVTNNNLTNNQINQKFLFQEFICYTICLIFQELIAVLLILLLHKKGLI
jgi:hypothetical protein